MTTRHNKEIKALETMFKLGLILDEEDQVLVEGMFFKKDYPEGVVPADYIHIIMEFGNKDNVCEKIAQIKKMDNYHSHCLYEDYSMQLAFNL